MIHELEVHFWEITCSYRKKWMGIINGRMGNTAPPTHFLFFFNVIVFKLYKTHSVDFYSDFDGHFKMYIGHIFFR